VYPGPVEILARLGEFSPVQSHTPMGLLLFLIVILAMVAVRVAGLESLTHAADRDAEIIDSMVCVTQSSVHYDVV
jgi:hypothetical protein